MTKICRWQERRTGWSLGPTEARSEYDADFGRIIHSGSFRRLQGKTQILNLGDSDFYRTRLTHSLEVAQIATGIVKQLKHSVPGHPAHSILPPTSLIQAISLTHDLGHPPFGHGGEVALNYCMRSYGGFEGNGQTLRIASKLEHFSNHNGYDFTRRTTLGILKYPTSYSIVVNPQNQPRLSTHTTAVALLDRASAKPPKCYFDSERDVVEWALQCFSDEDITAFTSFVKRDGKHAKAIHKSFDSTIMDVADDIAYGVHDLEDSIALGLISERDFRASISKDVCHPFLEFLKSKSGDAEPYDYMVCSLFGDGNARKRCISRLVGLMIRSVCFFECSEFCEPLLRFRVGLDGGHRKLLDALQHLVVERVIHSPNVQHLEFKGQTMVISVFEAIASDPKSLLPRDAFECYERADEPHRVICDFVAGMTDNYLLRTYERLFSPRMGSIFDRL